MANYPSYNILLGSLPEEESGVQDDYTPSGIQKSRIQQSQSYYRFNLLHLLTRAEWDTLHAFYRTNQRTAITLAFFDESPAVSYNVLFTAAPQITSIVAKDLMYVSVPLRGTKN